MRVLFFGFAFYIAGALRLLLLLPVVGLSVTFCAVAGVDENRIRNLAMRWCRIVLTCLGVRVRRRGADLTRGALLVGNHISWLDTLVFGASWHATFLANSEVAAWPVLGRVFRCAGILFIERGKGAQTAAREIAVALRDRRSVVLFPEGRTTDGRSVIRFQPRLMQAAVDTGAPVQAAAVRYVDAGGRRVVRHSFADATMLQSLWRTVAGPPITAEITLFPPLVPGDDRQRLARQVEQTVRAVVEKP